MILLRTLTAGVLLVCVSLGIGCAGSPSRRPVEGGPANTGPGSTSAARNFLEGRWSLLSFEVVPLGRDPIKVAGQGTLLYDAYGNMKMDIRVDEATGKTLAAAGIPVQQGMLSTEGRVVVDMQARKLTYVMEGAPAIGAPAGPLATNRPRYWQVEGNVLTLTTQDDQGKPMSVGRWQKQP